MAYDNVELFKQIEKRARYNVMNKKFFRNTDILKVAFCVSEERAYEILRDIMSSKINVDNSKEAIIDAYLKMLANGYMPLSQQFELMGGNKLQSVKNEAHHRAENFKKGNLMDMLEKVFNVSKDEMVPIVMKYLETVESYDFSFKVNVESFYKFLENDIEELDKQFERFDL